MEKNKETAICTKDEAARVGGKDRTPRLFKIHATWASMRPTPRRK